MAFATILLTIFSLSQVTGEVTCRNGTCLRQNQTLDYSWLDLGSLLKPAKVIGDSCRNFYSTQRSQILVDSTGTCLKFYKRLDCKGSPKVVQPGGTYSAYQNYSAMRCEPPFITPRRNELIFSFRTRSFGECNKIKIWFFRHYVRGHNPYWDIGMRVQGLPTYVSQSHTHIYNALKKGFSP